MTHKQAKNYTHSNKPLNVYYFGNGKGKTTAALGVSLRAAGHGWKVLILQAIKGSWPTGERVSIPKFLKPAVEIKAVGKGFVGIVDDKLPRKVHRDAAHEAVSLADKEISSGKWNLVVLDEYSDLPQLKLIPEKQLVDIISKPRNKTDVIVTGHTPLKQLISACHTVTEMKKMKHPFDSGIIAKKGIDY